MKLDQVLETKIVSSISEMDVRMLDTLLPENGIYEDTFKEVWLGKLITFFKMCKKMGDTVLTVSQQQCVGGHWCQCNQKMWLFKSERTGKGFAIYFEMLGGEIKRIERCYGHYIDDLKETYSNETFDIEAFYVYSHEMIGFIDTYELKELRKDAKLFMSDLMDPERRSLGSVSLKRLVSQYNQLYFDARNVPCLFEYRIELLQIYEDLFSLRNMFAQHKSFQLVINKCRELIQCTDNKSKAKVLKWFLRNENKVNNYLVYYFDLQVEEYKMVYLYRVNLVDHRLTIRHPNIPMDVESCNLLQTYIKLFYDYMQNVHVKSIAYDPNDDSVIKIYNYFKDKMDDVMMPCDAWISSVVGRSVM